MSEEIWNKRDVAEAFHVVPSTVGKWLRAGKVAGAFRTPGGHWRFRADEVRVQVEDSKKSPL